MQLDGFTIIAQMVNFLLLVALLKRFLYGPIIRAMEAREAHIAARLHEADDKIATAEQQNALYNNRLQALQATQETVLLQAKEDAETQRHHLLEQARQDVQQLQSRWREAVQQERAAFLQELRRQAGQQVCAVAHRALADLARADLEHEVIAVFLDRLQALDRETRHTLAAALQDNPSIRIRSAFALPWETRQQLIEAVREHIVEGVEVQFTTAPELICGIELEAQGRKIAWNIEQYCDTLEEHVALILAQEIAVSG